MAARNVLARGGLMAVVVYAGAALVNPEACSAQVRRYQPQRPTVSPYLNLTRFDNGSIPNYYSLVRPQLEQQAFNSEAQAIRRQQSGALIRLQNDIQTGLQPAAPTGTGSWFQTTGTSSTFLDTAGYYAQVGSGTPQTGIRRAPIQQRRPQTSLSRSQSGLGGSQLGLGVSPAGRGISQPGLGIPR